jgi:hypothetical protein
MMNVAGKRSGSWKTRVFATIVIALVLATTCSILYAWERGPIHCDNGCLVQAPYIDPLTQQFLESMRAPVDDVPFWMFATGTSYMVCNATHCATYRQTFEGKYITDERVPINPPPSPPGGNGGGYGVLPGGGGGSGWTGAVDLGPITPLPPGQSGFPPGVPLVPCSLGGGIQWVPVGGCDF